MASIETYGNFRDSIRGCRLVCSAQELLGKGSGLPYNRDILHLLYTPVNLLFPLLSKSALL